MATIAELQAEIATLKAQVGTLMNGRLDSMEERILRHNTTLHDKFEAHEVDDKVEWKAIHKRIDSFRDGTFKVVGAVGIQLLIVIVGLVMLWLK